MKLPETEKMSRARVRRAVDAAIATGRLKANDMGYIESAAAPVDGQVGPLPLPSPPYNIVGNGNDVGNSQACGV